MMHLKPLTIALTAVTLGACSTHQGLSPDFAQAYQQAFTAQTDLARPSAEGATFLLSGREAAAIRINVQESSSNTESAKSQTSF